MSKHGKTKNEILKLISEGTDNPSKISAELGLSLSTVSKHLHDLEHSGLIEAEDRSFAPKWKHYRIAEHKSQEAQEQKPIINRSPAWKAGLIMSVVAAAFALFAYFVSAPIYVPIGITDPPQVPYGTQGLYINYSSLMVHVVGKSGGSRWIDINASGSLNLMSLINESEVIGSAKLPSGSSINAVRFNISSSAIEINNETYPVSVAGSSILVPVVNATLNSTSEILLDFSPMVVGSSSGFVMLPSANGFIVRSPAGLRGSAMMKFTVVHAKYQLQGGTLLMLMHSASNLTAINASVSGHGNFSALRINARNLGSKNVTIYGVAIASLRGFNSSKSSNSLSALSKGRGWIMRQFNSTLVINSTNFVAIGRMRGSAINISLPYPVYRVVIQGGPMRSQWPAAGFSGLQALFVATGNGTLIKAEQWHGYHIDMGNDFAGYVVAAHGSAYLSYNGPVSLSNSTGTYSVILITNRGLASANLTYLGSGGSG
ncbi:MAG: ArsR family transcriptional regulator [Candidatus Micrarchaeaceae archaeon]